MTLLGPTPPESSPHAGRPWRGPPQHQVGGIVPLQLVVARTSTIMIAVQGLVAYLDGLAMTLSVRCSPEEARRRWDEEDAIDRRRAQGLAGAEPLPPELLRFGIELADGRRATNVAAERWALRRQSDVPDEPVLAFLGGQGSVAWVQDGYWLWPLPPSGPVIFACEWPAQGVPLSRAEIDAGVVLAATRQTQTLWEEQPGDDRARFSGRGGRFHMVVFGADDDDDELDDESDEEEQDAYPPWLGPPDDELGVVLPMGLPFARSEDTAIMLTHLVAYRQGFEFSLAIFRRLLDPEPPNPLALHDRSLRLRFAKSGKLPEEFLRLGIQFSDGRRATNLTDPEWHFAVETEEPPSEPVLVASARGGPGRSRRAVRHGGWVWPLPSSGPLEFVCEWPAERIAETRLEVSADPLLESAARAQRLWAPPRVV
jgi:hypothetical protein